MEIIWGCFISRDQAVEAAEYLRGQGFKGGISVIGWHNMEDSYENRRSDNSGGLPGLAFAGGTYGAVGGLAVSNFSSVGPLVPLPVFVTDGISFNGGIEGSLKERGVPESQWDEIRQVVESGSSVIIVECEYSDRSKIVDTLQDKGVQNMHV